MPCQSGEQRGGGPCVQPRGGATIGRSGLSADARNCIEDRRAADAWQIAFERIVRSQIDEEELRGDRSGEEMLLEAKVVLFEAPCGEAESNCHGSPGWCDPWLRKFKPSDHGERRRTDPKRDALQRD